MSLIFWRQVFVMSGPWTLYFLNGVCLGFPTVMLAQLRKANQTISMEQGSWLPALHAYNGIPWVIILSTVAVALGRKKCHLVVCISTLIGFICFYFSTDLNHFFIGEIFQGALSGAFLTINIIILTEYGSPQYRGIFLTFKCATIYWGILVANALGTYFHWRSVVLLGLTCCVYTLVNVIAWPESPLWLATKRRYVECEKSHRWLKGTSSQSEKELANILNYHKGKILKQEWSARHLCAVMGRTQFYKPIMLSSLLICLNSFSGKLICTVFAIEILKKITNSEETCYRAMLILDGVTVSSMYVGCLLSKILKRRIILIGCSAIGIAVMVVISVFFYLSKLGIIDENIYVSILLLAAYSISISCGPIMMCTTMVGELLPLQARMLSTCLISLIFKVTHGTIVKLSPLCFKNWGMHGTFALFAGLSGIFVVLIYLYIPETKDKTLQEICDSYRGREVACKDENCHLVDVGEQNVRK